MKKQAVVVAVMLFLQVVAVAADSSFYVYSDKADKRNHWIPSGYMGDWADIKVKEDDNENPHDGRTNIRIVYDAQARQGANWAGVYWQHPANNWGEKPGGFDLKGYKRLTFWAKGAKGGEQIATFKVGGISGTFMDTDQEETGPVTLTKEWTKYTIDLKDKDLSKIIGGFCWSASKDDNPNGFTIYFDEIRYEK